MSPDFVSSRLTPIPSGKILNLAVGVAATDLNILCETWKFLRQEFELSAPLRTALDEHVAVETRLGFQGEACRAVEQCLWLHLRQIGQEQRLRRVFGALISACIPVSRAGERVDVPLHEGMLLRRLVL